MVLRAWIIDRVVVGEGDIRVTFFCDGRGVFTATAKSAAKRDSKLRGSLEPHRLVDMLLAGSVYKPTIAECQVVGPYSEPDRKPLLIQYSQLLKTYPPTPDALPIIPVLERAVQMVNERMWGFHMATLNAILERSGVALELGQCVECGVRETVVWHHALERGGVSCHTCTPESPALEHPVEPLSLAKMIWNHARYFAPIALPAWGKTITLEVSL